MEIYNEDKIKMWKDNRKTVVVKYIDKSSVEYRDVLDCYIRIEHSKHYLVLLKGYINYIEEIKELITDANNLIIPMDSITHLSISKGIIKFLNAEEDAKEINNIENRYHDIITCIMSE